MPKGTVQEESKWPFEEGVYYSCVLAAVEERAMKWTDKATGEPRERPRWRWSFKIVEGESTGMHLNFDSDPGITTGADDLGRMAVEALLGVQFTVGMEVDTDQYLMLPCYCTIRREEPKETKSGPNAGKLFYGTPINGIYPADLDVSAISDGRASGGAGGVVDQTDDPWASKGDPPY